jgi:excinuclease ABC subunit C
LPNRKNPVLFPKGDSGLMLLMRVRDEAHRFAHTYHSKARKKQTIGSKLDEVEGIGSKKRQILLKTFGSLTQLLQATDDDIERVPGIGKKDVERIRFHFGHRDVQLNLSR